MFASLNFHCSLLLPALVMGKRALMLISLVFVCFRMGLFQMLGKLSSRLRNFNPVASSQMMKTHK